MQGLIHGRKRKLLFGGGLFLLLLLALIGLVLYQQRNDSVRIILEKVASSQGVDMQITEVDVRAEGKLVLRNIELNDLGHIDFLEINWQWRDLARRHIQQLRVHGVELRSGELQKLQKDRGAPDSANSDPVEIQPFSLGKLIIGQAVLLLDDLGSGIPPIPLRLGEVTPLVFDDLKLGGASNDPAANVLQKVEVNDFVIYSPYDSLAKVLSFEKITLVFSWAGIQLRQIDQLAIEKPIIYAGEELFWLVDQVRQMDKTTRSPQENDIPWQIANFRVVGGRLVVTALGNPGFTLPVIYEVERKGLVLSDFANTPLKTDLEIPPTNLNYPEYGVRISNLRGKLQFSLPPGENTQDNIVNTVEMDSISWKGVTATNAWSSFTLDKNGIYCDLGAETYGGYTNGNLSILVNEGMRWVAGIYVQDTEVRSVAEKLAPEYIKFNGAVSGDLIIEGQQQMIGKVDGEINWEKPGSLEVVAVDDLLQKLPEEWYPAKRDAARIALEAFRNYDYTQGRCSFSYGPPDSSIDLQFQGKQGKREFAIDWHDLRDNPGFGW